MIVAYDLHGVITSDPEAYKSVMATLCQTDNTTVWVISGPMTVQVKRELDSLGFVKGKHYHGIASVVDYLLNKDEEHRIDEGGNYWFDENSWWSAKADICKELRVDVLTDDHQEYGDHFTEDHPTKFILKKKTAPVG